MEKSKNKQPSFNKSGLDGYELNCFKTPNKQSIFSKVKFRILYLTIFLNDKTEFLDYNV